MLPGLLLAVLLITQEHATEQRRRFPRLPRAARPANMNHTSPACLNSSTSWPLRKKKMSKSYETRWILLFLRRNRPEELDHVLI